MSKIIAVSVTNTAGLEAPFNPRFGRADAFVLVNEEGELVEVLTNPLISAGHGAGTGAAALLGDHGVTDAISGHFGPKAAAGLNALGISMWLATEGITAAEAIARLERGDLKRQVEVHVP